MVYRLHTCRLHLNQMQDANNPERSFPRSHEHSKHHHKNYTFYIVCCPTKNGGFVRGFVPQELSCPKITALAKSPSTHPLQNSISYLQYPSNLLTLLHSPIIHHTAARIYCTCACTRLSLGPISSSMFLYRPPVSSSQKFCNLSLVNAASALWNELSKDLRQFAPTYFGRCRNSECRVISLFPI